MENTIKNIILFLKFIFVVKLKKIKLVDKIIKEAIRSFERKIIIKIKVK